MTLPPDGDKQALAKTFEQRILTGRGMAPAELRARAFDNRDLPEPLATLVDKVGRRARADGCLRLQSERLPVLRRRAHGDGFAGCQERGAVTAVLTDLDSAPLNEGLRATLRMLGKLTRDGHLLWTTRASR